MQRFKMSTMGILVLSFIMLMGCAAVSPQPAHAAWETVVGKAPLGADEAAAEQAAIDAALRQAVEKQAGALIQGNTRIRNGQVVMDDVMASYSGYIRDKRIHSSMPSADGKFYVVTMEVDVLVDTLRQKIASMEDQFEKYQQDMQRKNVIVLGIREFNTDLPWARKPFALMVQMAQDKLRQARFTVLDESAIQNYAAIIDTIRTGQLNRAGLIELARASNADYMVMVAMDATFKQRDNSNPFNTVGANLRVDLLDVNTGDYHTGKYERGTKRVNAANPSQADLREAVTDLAREVGELAITDTVYALMNLTGHMPNTGGGAAPAPAPVVGAPVGTGGGAGAYARQRYVIVFERFQDQHVDSILSDLDGLPGVEEAQVQRQTQRETRVQVFYSGRSNTLRTGIKQILQRHGYGQFRVNFAGNRLIFKNTIRF